MVLVRPLICFHADLADLSGLQLADISQLCVHLRRRLAEALRPRDRSIWSICSSYQSAICWHSCLPDRL